MRVVNYARLSRRTDSTAPNLADQLKRCREHATGRGWTIVAEHSDFDSAFDRDAIDDREGFAQVLDLVAAGEVDVVLAWAPDRLWRDQIEAAMFLRSCVRGGVQIVSTVAEGDRDPSNPGDEMVATIIAAVGRYESHAKARRLRAKHRQLAELGRIAGGGKRPFGWDKDRRTIRPDEAALIRLGARMLLDGAPLAAVARTFNASGIAPTAGAARWKTTSLRSMFMSPRLAGLRTHRGKVVATAEWPAILTVDEFDAVRAILDDPNRRPGPPVRNYLLTGGIAVCGVCTTPLVSQATHGHRGYRCPSGVNARGCGKIVRMADPVEETVAEHLFAAIDEGVFLAAAPDTTAVDVDEVPRLRARLDQLSRDHYVAELIGRDEYFAARAPLAERLDDLQAAAGRPTLRPRRDLSMLRSDWGAMSFDQRRSTIVDLVRRVTIMPVDSGSRARFDATKVRTEFNT